MKKIAYITTSSNFERQKNMVKAAHRRLKELGDYALYVITGYGIYTGTQAVTRGEGAIYRLLEVYEFDGYLIESNIGLPVQLECILDMIRGKGKPILTINILAEGVPYLSMESYQACYDLVEHLIAVHGCRKINMVLSWEKDILSRRAIAACQTAMAKYGIPYEEKRVIYRNVSIQKGKGILEECEKLGIADADAVICAHDVNAIGLCLAMEERGRSVPEDLIICSLNYSTNSMIFRPDITGADRMDEGTSVRACELLDQMINGQQIPMENYIHCTVHYGRSCGCAPERTKEGFKRYQDLIVGKVEAGGQTSQIIRFTDGLEETVSLEQFSENIIRMLTGVGIDNFYCCINAKDMGYIIGEKERVKKPEDPPYDRDMVVLAGRSADGGEMIRVKYDLPQLVPEEVKAGDIMVFFPIHHRERDFGYLAVRNEYYPIEQYNFRNCHESIGASIENLRRQMILKKSIQELDELHMSDQLTGLYNRFAFDRYKTKYTAGGRYAVAMLDMDGLKIINDNFGHLAGNHAITLTANAIRECADADDLLVRYGGDEFEIISFRTEEAYWEAFKADVNGNLREQMDQQKLPYELGVSVGYAISGGAEPLPFEDVMNLADRRMYEDKIMRKKGRI